VLGVIKWVHTTYFLTIRKAGLCGMWARWTSNLWLSTHYGQMMIYPAGPSIRPFIHLSICPASNERVVLQIKGILSPLSPSLRTMLRMVKSLATTWNLTRSRPSSKTRFRIQAQELGTENEMKSALKRFMNTPATRIDNWDLDRRRSCNQTGGYPLRS